MSKCVRVFVGASLVALVAAAVLNVPALLSGGLSWAAFVHLALFGWATGIIVAVRYHAVPAIVGRAFPCPRLLGCHVILFLMGVGLAAAGLLASWPAAYVAGLALELAASLVFVANVSWLVRRGPIREEPAAPTPPIADLCRLDRLSGVATTIAGLCLPASLLLLLAVRVRWLQGSWYLSAIHLATLGWVTLMIVGVAYRLLPRLSGRPTRGVPWVRLQLACFLGALVVMVTSVGVGHVRAFAVGAGVMAAALALFAWSVWPALEPVRDRPGGVASGDSGGAS